MSDDGILEVDGSDAKREIMHSASSISRTASMKVGYLDDIYELGHEMRCGKASHLSLIIWSRR
jgi:hypothetical protein